VLRLANLAPDQARGGTAAEDRLDLERAITGLPAKYRLVLALRYYLDLPIAEVAEVLDLTVPATKSRIRRALKAMGIVLEALGEQR
jgi:RNA polymerase sigma factor (sigma-70 family)